MAVLEAVLPDDGSPIGPPFNWVRYYYADPASAAEFNEYVLAAITWWEPAYQYSSLRVGMDYNCRNPLTWICKPGVMTKDALYISHASPPEEPQGEGASPKNTRFPGSSKAHKATVYFAEKGPSYVFPPRGMAPKLGKQQAGSREANYEGCHGEGNSAASLGYQWSTSDKPFRNTLHIGLDSFNPGPKGPTPEHHENVKLQNVVAIAHELVRLGARASESGAVTEQHLICNCKNLRGYEEAMQAVAKSEDRHFEGLKAEERMQKVYRDWSLAEEHFPSAMGFMPMTQPLSGDGPRENSPEYDYLSMMHYRPQPA